MRYVLMLLVAVLAASHVAANAAELKPLDERTQCLLVCHEVLLNVKARDTSAVLAKIGDGGGADRISIMPPPDHPRRPERMDGAKTDEEFLTKSFPHYELVLKNFATMRVSDAPERRKVQVRIKYVGGDTKEGELLTYFIAIPEVQDAPWHHNDSNGRKMFSHLRFLKYEGKVYWVPFGW